MRLYQRIDEYEKPESENYFDRHPSTFLTLNLLGMSLANAICYSLIPVFVARSGATLMNISNVTAVLWGMLFDMAIFSKRFYPLNVLAFFMEILGMVIFSIDDPVYGNQRDL